MDKEYEEVLDKLNPKRKIKPIKFTCKLRKLIDVEGELLAVNFNTGKMTVRYNKSYILTVPNEPFFEQYEIVSKE